MFTRISGPSWTCLSVEGCTSVEVFPLNAIKEVHDDVPNISMGHLRREHVALPSEDARPPADEEGRVCTA